MIRNPFKVEISLHDAPTHHTYRRVWFWEVRAYQRGGWCRGRPWEKRT